MQKCGVCAHNNITNKFVVMPEAEAKPRDNYKRCRDRGERGAVGECCDNASVPQIEVYWIHMPCHFGS